jgi:hypothetical protein
VSQAARPDRPGAALSYPNPFAASTRFEYILSRADDITVDIFDLRGELVERLFAGRAEAGTHSIRWTPRGVPGGVYMCRVRGGSIDLSRSIVYVNGRP